MDSSYRPHFITGYLYFYPLWHQQAAAWENECFRNAFGAPSNLIFHMEM